MGIFPCSIAFAPSGQTIAVGGNLGELCIISTESGSIIRSPYRDKLFVGPVAFTPNGKSIIALRRGLFVKDSRIEVIDAVSWERDLSRLAELDVEGCHTFACEPHLAE